VRKHGDGDRIPGNPPSQQAEEQTLEENRSRGKRRTAAATGSYLVVRRERGLRAPERERERSHAQARAAPVPSHHPRRIGAGNPGEIETGEGGRGGGEEEEAGMWTRRREGREANGEVKDDGDPAMRMKRRRGGRTIHARFPPSFSHRYLCFPRQNKHDPPNAPGGVYRASR
jgi:hypothetical protein